MADLLIDVPLLFTVEDYVRANLLPFFLDIAAERIVFPPFPLVWTNEPLQSPERTPRFSPYERKRLKNK